VRRNLIITRLLHFRIGSCAAHPCFIGYIYAMQCTFAWPFTVKRKLGFAGCIPFLSVRDMIARHNELMKLSL
jgi:hypothetical protein